MKPGWTRLVRRVLSEWQAWRDHRALLRACPELAEIDRREKDAIRRGDTRAIGKARKDRMAFMTADLRKAAEAMKEAKSRKAKAA